MPGQTYNITLDLLGAAKVNSGLASMQDQVGKVASAYSRAAQVIAKTTAVLTALRDVVDLVTEAWKLGQAKMREFSSFQEAEAAAGRFRRTLGMTIEELVQARKLSVEAGDALQARVDAAHNNALKLRAISQEIIALQGGSGPAAAGPHSAKIAAAESDLAKALEAERFARLTAENQTTVAIVRQHFATLNEIANEAFDARTAVAAKSADAEEELRLLAVQREKELTTLRIAEAEKVAAVKKDLDERMGQELAAQIELNNQVEEEDAARRTAEFDRQIAEYSQFIQFQNEIEREEAENRLRTEEETARRKLKVQRDYQDSTTSLLGSAAQAAQLFGRKGFLAWKAIALAQAVISGAAAVLSQLGGGDPYSAWIRAAAAAAAAAVQIAVIASTSPPAYAAGGMTPGSATLATVGERGPEFVVNNRGLQNIGAAGMNMLAGINAGLINAADFAAGVPASLDVGLPGAGDVATGGGGKGSVVFNVVTLRDAAEMAAFLESAEGETIITNTVRDKRIEIGIPT